MKFNRQERDVVGQSGGQEVTCVAIHQAVIRTQTVLYCLQDTSDEQLLFHGLTVWQWCRSTCRTLTTVKR
jgi:hypothetical protein